MPRSHDSVALLLEPARWQPRPRPADRSDRWTTWAQWLRTRHARIAIRYHALGLILARNQLISRRQIEHRHHHSARLLSRIQLSIGPILLRFGDAATRLLLALPRSRDEKSPGGVTPESVDRGQRNGQHWSLNQLQLNQLQGAASTGAGVPFRTSSAVRQDSSFQSPLMRVFDRESKPASDLTRFEARLVQRSLQLVTRVLTERRRLEEDVRRHFVSREQRVTPAVNNNAIAENTVFESSRTMRTGTDGPATPSGWPIDIEKLTEQVVRAIDGRIVAHRERLGRVF